MFPFAIIETTDGIQIIDKSVQTPYEALTAVQMAEYIELDNCMYHMDRVRKRKKFLKGRCKN